MGMKVVDEAGKVYGSLTVIEPVESKKDGQHWLCKCKCGNEVIFAGTTLRQGQIRCSRHCTHDKHSWGLIDEAGNVYGEWTVLEVLPNVKPNRRGLWRCSCSCGAIKNVRGSALRSGRSKSCRTCAQKQVHYNKFNDIDSFTYAIKVNEFVKFGATVDVKRRVQQLQVHNPDDLFLLETFENFNEEMLHNIFRHRHHRGEWYGFERTIDKTTGKPNLYFEGEIL